MLFIKALTVLALSAFAVASPVDAGSAAPADAAANVVAQDGPYGYEYRSERHLREGFCKKWDREREEHCRRAVRRCDEYRDGSREERRCYEQVKERYDRNDWREYRPYY